MAEFRDRLKAAMQAKGMNQKELAEAAGIWPSLVSDYIRGKFLAKQDKVDALAKALEVSPAWLMGIDGNDTPDFDPSRFDNIAPIATKKLPLLGSIACGVPIFADQQIEAYVVAGTAVRADFVLRAQGDSMIGAGIKDGDLVFIRTQSIVDNGEVAAVVIDDEATLKRVYFHDRKRLVLQSENPQYPPLVYTEDELDKIEIIGKAIAYQSDVR